MFALTIDQRHSRTSDDRVPSLLAALAAVPAALPFERTVGDEIQGLLRAPEAVAEALRIVLRAGDWWVGLGIGEVESPLPASVRAARGPALVDARAAVERAKTIATGVAVASASKPEKASEIEALVGLLGTLITSRTAAQWRVIDAVEATASQQEAAHRLGVTPQNVSKSLGVAQVAIERAGYPLLVRLLKEADA